MKRYLSPWQCDSDLDYYAQFESEPDNEPDIYDDDDYCPYHCEGRYDPKNGEVVWEVQQ